MTLLQRLKEGMEKATEQATALAQTTRIKMEIGRLNDRKNSLLADMGRQVYLMYQQGQTFPGMETLCQRVRETEAEIQQKGVEMERIQAAS